MSPLSNLKQPEPWSTPTLDEVSIGARTATGQVGKLPEGQLFHVAENPSVTFYGDGS